MKEISDRYNALPIEVRNITSGVIAEMQIRQLKMERDRVRERYSQSVKEINEHIQNIERDLTPHPL